MSDIFEKHQMTEEDIKLQYITPALTAKWDVKKITMETSPVNNFTDGKVRIKGNIPSRDKGKRCDYVLWHNKGTPLAIEKIIIIHLHSECSRQSLMEL